MFQPASSIDSWLTLRVRLGNYSFQNGSIMGLFKGSIASLVSGKVGGLVFQKNNRVRPYRMPLNPRTTAQDVVRGAFIVAAAAWSALDQAAQDAWTTWGQSHPKINRIGDSITMTGKQALIGLNVPRIQAGGAIVDESPGETPLNVTPVGAGPTGAIVGGADILTLTGFSTTNAGVRMAVYIGKPRSASSVRGRKALAFAGIMPVYVVTPIITGTVTLPSGTAVTGDVYDVKIITRQQDTLVYSEQYDTVVAS